MRHLGRIIFSLLLALAVLSAQQKHNYAKREQLGKVFFSNSCLPVVQEQFNRGVALLHSFAYGAAENAFEKVAERDPRCAMAHWGIAMSQFHQLWDPPLTLETIQAGKREIQFAQQIGTGTEREREFIRALGFIYQQPTASSYHARAANYEIAMRDLALKHRRDVEAQVFYALALLANMSPADKSHTKQKQAADILEPLFRKFQQHPGIAHYLIHAYDNAELAPRGLAAARAYSQVASSAPHALHMPSHIFTRLGLWDESIQANLAARQTAHRQGDTGEELHAMDYLVYAYLQSGRDNDAAQVIQQLKNMPKLDQSDFKIAYASTTMPIRYAVERGRWDDAASVVPRSGAPPHLVAIALWARGLGLARSDRASATQKEVAQLREIELQLRASGNAYWASQTDILLRELEAWSAEADHRPGEAVAVMRAVADDEDTLEKLPVTPGAIIPAREQLGDLLLEQNHPQLAQKEFEAVLSNAPGRRGARQGAAHAAALSGEK
jgi:hypothetical protein